MDLDLLRAVAHRPGRSFVETVSGDVFFHRDDPALVELEQAGLIEFRPGWYLTASGERVLDT